MRWARAATCSFSSRTVTIREPSRTWRKKVRWPGSPTVPATNRSGESNRMIWWGTKPTLFAAASAAHFRVSCPVTPAPQPDAQPGSRVVQVHDERTAIGVCDDGDRSRVHDDALERIEVQAERICHDRLDHVAV